MVKKKTTKRSNPKKGPSKAKRPVKKETVRGKTCRPAPSCGSLTYFLAFLGAAIYYISTATGFWNGVLGILKAIVWPVFLIFEIMKYIGI